MKLVRNPNYWRMGEDGQPLPYLDGITFEVIPEDATRILKLKAGELDGAEFIPYSRVERAAGRSGPRHGALPLDPRRVRDPECPPAARRQATTRSPTRRSGRR